MNEKTEQEIIEILNEQRRMRAEEHFAGNIVKERFHKGAIFGIKVVVNALATQPAVEEDAEPGICTCHYALGFKPKVCLQCGKRTA